MSSCIQQPPCKPPSEKPGQVQSRDSHGDAPTPANMVASLSLCPCSRGRSQNPLTWGLEDSAATAHRPVPPGWWDCYTRLCMINGDLSCPEPGMEVQPGPSLRFTHPTHGDLALLHRPRVAWGDTTLPATSTHHLPHEQGCTGRWGS